MTWTLRSLLDGLAVVPAALDCAVTSLTLDSRRVQPGALFLACAGTRTHGYQFIEDAIRRGAVAIAVDAAAQDLAAPPGIAVVAVPALGEHVGEIAARYYHDPSSRLTVIGVTGTNGKTSVSQFIAEALSAEAKVGVVGTLGSGLYGELTATGHTTPDALRLQGDLAAFVDQGARYVVMEVSSHALEQGRVNGVHFTVGVFTNLSHEHLDYHGDMAAYARAKERLFHSPGLQSAVVNNDDAVGRSWLPTLRTGVKSLSFGLHAGEEPPLLSGRGLELSPHGLTMTVSSPWGEAELGTGLLGRFNASNLLAALGALLAVGMSFDTAISRLRTVRTVAGRMERFGGDGRPLIAVDFAHTPDALEQVLAALREHCPASARLWCVFGCGGDRDKAKRPLMGKVAQQLADAVIITNDNPRYEDPNSIIEEIQRGMTDTGQVEVIADRGKAIHRAITGAGETDVVLVAGKGHETEQQIGAESLPFSDREVVLRELAQWGDDHG